MRQSDDDQRICVASISGAHGVHGLARLRVFTEDTWAVADYGPVTSEDGAHVFELTLKHEAKPGVLVADLGVEITREQVEALRGTKLYVARDALPDTEDEDEFYYSDLVGLEARTNAGDVWGRVQAVENFGAGELLDIRLEGSTKTVLVPFTRENVPDVKVKDGYVTAIPLKGLDGEGLDGPEADGDE